MTHDNRTGEHLDRLEETAYFLENNLRDLSDALLSQQREITALKQRLETLEQRLNLALQLLDGQGSVPDGGHERPPHYL